MHWVNDVAMNFTTMPYLSEPTCTINVQSTTLDN